MKIKNYEIYAESEFEITSRHVYVQIYEIEPKIHLKFLKAKAIKFLDKIINFARINGIRLSNFNIRLLDLYFKDLEKSALKPNEYLSFMTMISDFVNRADTLALLDIHWLLRNNLNKNLITEFVKDGFLTLKLDGGKFINNLNKNNGQKIVLADKDIFIPKTIKIVASILKNLKNKYEHKDRKFAREILRLIQKLNVVKNENANFIYWFYGGNQFLKLFLVQQENMKNDITKYTLKTEIGQFSRILVILMKKEDDLSITTKSKSLLVQKEISKYNNWLKEIAGKNNLNVINIRHEIEVIERDYSKRIFNLSV